MNRLRLHIQPGAVIRVGVEGDLCISSSRILEACVIRLVSLQTGALLLLDLRGVGFCDLTALRCLWRLRDTARERGVEIELLRSPPIERLERLVAELTPARAA